MQRTITTRPVDRQRATGLMPRNGNGVAPGGARTSAADHIEHTIRAALGERAFARHLTGAGTMSVDDGVLLIRVGTRFVADQITRRFETELNRAAQALGCAEAKVDTLDPDADRMNPMSAMNAVTAEADAGIQPHASQSSAAGAHGAGVQGRPASGVEAGTHTSPRASHGSGHAQTAQATHAAARRRVRDELTFARFLVGESNRLAYATAERVASDLENSGLSPIFLHGPCGNGKTHLLRAIVTEVEHRFPGTGCLYTTADEFTRQFVQAIRKNEVSAFQRKHRGLRVLCIDDAHAFCGKTATQAELVQTLDAAGLSGTTVVLASDESPDAFEEMHESLRSRLCGGAVVPIGAPDPALRERIIQARAMDRGLPLDDAAVSAVAHGLSLTTHHGTANSKAGPARSVRELEGALCRVEAMYRVMPELCTSDGRIGALLVSRAAQLDTAGTGNAEPDHSRPVPVQTVVRTICRELCVESDELRGRGRHKRVVLARALITHAARETTNLSYPEIARSIGRPNHSTVITAHQRIRKQMTEGEHVAIGSRFDGLTMTELAQQMIACVRRQSESSRS